MKLFFNFSNNKFAIDYCGQKHLYKHAKSRYRADQEVTIYYPHLMTDTDYYFYLDDERLNVSYDNKKGIIINFIMPKHNVKLYMTSNNNISRSSKPYLD